MTSSPVDEAVSAVVDVLDRLGIPWLIGGSLASSVHGSARSTLDVDMVLALALSEVRPLVEALEPDFYVDEAAVREAVRSRASFNAIHNATIVKIDIYVLTPDPFEQSAFSRGVLQRLPGASERAPAFRFCTAEDIILPTPDLITFSGSTGLLVHGDLLYVGINGISTYPALK